MIHTNVKYDRIREDKIDCPTPLAQSEQSTELELDRLQADRQKRSHPCALSRSPTESCFIFLTSSEVSDGMARNDDQTRQNGPFTHCRSADKPYTLLYQGRLMELVRVQ